MRSIKQWWYHSPTAEAMRYFLAAGAVAGWLVCSYLLVHVLMYSLGAVIGIAILFGLALLFILWLAD